MSGILEYSTTPSSNTTINSIGIQGTSAVNNFDNAFRQMMADVASSVTRRVTKSANYTAIKTDNAQLIEFTAAATLSLTAAATLTNGWSCIVKANGGDVLIDPSSSEQIDGASTKTIKDGSFAFVFCTGTAFVSLEAVQIDAYTKTQSDARYATAAQGVLAQNALPKSGGDLSDNVDMANTKFYRGKETGGTARTLIGMWSDDKIYVGATGLPMQLRGSSINAENLTINGAAVPTVYTGSDASETTFPVGHTLLLHDAGAARNASITPRLWGTNRYSTGGGGAVLSGTWRARGEYAGGGAWGLLSERVA